MNMAIMKQVKIHDEYITLGQFLKIVDLVSSGGEVKYFISENLILVNGEEENRRGRKLYRNDQIEVNDLTYKIC